MFLGVFGRQKSGCLLMTERITRNRSLQLPLPLWRARAALDVRAMVRCGLVRVERETTLPSEARHESLPLVPRLECNQGHCGPKLALWHCNRLAEENVEITSHFLCGVVVDIAPVLQEVLDLGDLLEHPADHILALCWGKPRRKTTEEKPGARFGSSAAACCPTPSS